MKKPIKRDFQTLYNGELVYKNIDNYVEALENYCEHLEQKKEVAVQHLSGESIARIVRREIEQSNRSGAGLDGW